MVGERDQPFAEVGRRIEPALVECLGDDVAFGDVACVGVALVERKESDVVEGEDLDCTLVLGSRGREA